MSVEKIVTVGKTEARKAKRVGSDVFLVHEHELPTKIYVAGKFYEAERLRGEMAKLKQLGFQITHDWTTNEAMGPRTPEYLQKWAEFDINGVKEADFVIADMTDPEYPYRGTWCEIGCAYGLGKPVWIIAATPSTNCFYWHSSAKHFKCWDEVYAELK